MRALALVLALAAGAAQADWLEKDLTACRAKADDAERLACYDSLVPANSVAADAVPAPVVRLVGRFEGWAPRQVLTLDNGQVWTYIDSRPTWRDQPLVDPAVSLRQSFSGAWWMAIEGERTEGKVKRLR